MQYGISFVRLLFIVLFYLWCDRNRIFTNGVQSLFFFFFGIIPLKPKSNVINVQIVQRERESEEKKPPTHRLIYAFWRRTFRTFSLVLPFGAQFIWSFSLYLHLTLLSRHFIQLNYQVEAIKTTIRPKLHTNRIYFFFNNLSGFMIICQLPNTRHLQSGSCCSQQQQQ